MYKVIPTEHFNKDVEYYIKKKKYINIEDDIKKVTSELKKGNLIGKDISEVRTSSNCRILKVRAKNSNINGGKSNGYRIIYYVVTEDNAIYLLTIYSKKDDNRIPTNKEIQELVDKEGL